MVKRHSTDLRFSFEPPSLALSSHPARGSGEVTAVGLDGPSCVTTDLREGERVGREREGPTGLLAEPATHQRLLTAATVADYHCLHSYTFMIMMAKIAHETPQKTY